MHVFHIQDNDIISESVPWPWIRILRHYYNTRMLIASAWPYSPSSPDQQTMRLQAGFEASGGLPNIGNELCIVLPREILS